MPAAAAAQGGTALAAVPQTAVTPVTAAPAPRGDGGDVQLRFWVTESGVQVPVTNYGEGVTLRSEGGDGGAAGAGGQGGAGGRARYEKRSTGRTIAREAGDDGAAGASGRSGREGRPGRTLLEVVAPEDASRVGS